MKKYLFILLLLAFCFISLCVSAERITLEMSRPKLSEALHKIDSMQTKYHIHYDEKELEDFWIPLLWLNYESPKSAVKIACEGIPVSITTKGHDIYVKCTRKTEFLYRGRVLDMSGNPLDSVELELLNPYDNSLYTKATTSKDGGFSIPYNHNPVIFSAKKQGFKDGMKFVLEDEIGNFRMLRDIDNNSSWNEVYQEKPKLSGLSIHLDKAGTLASRLTDEQKDTCRNLTVSGEMNSADIRTLRQMAGYKEDGSKTGRLERIDLLDAEFKTDKTPFMSIDAAEEHLVAYTMSNRHSAGPGYPQFQDMTQRLTPEGYYPDIENTGKRIVEYIPGWSRNDEMSIASFVPKYVLNANPDLKTKAVRVAKNRTWATAVFGAGKLSRRDWKNVRRYNLRNYKGHRLSYEKGYCKWNVSLYKGTAAMDMFYKCPSMKEVRLPHKTKLDDNIFVVENEVKYIVSKESLFWNNLDKFNKKGKRGGWFERVIPESTGR